MNHKQWEALREGTKGHTPGPWDTTEDRAVTYVIRENGTRLMWEGWCVSQDMTLAAAAPDLLSEVERLRLWIFDIQAGIGFHGEDKLYDLCQDALNGAEVPE
jgi:hypothetical protein